MKGKRNKKGGPFLIKMAQKERLQKKWDKVPLINTKTEFKMLTKELGVGHDWHEPDCQLVTVSIKKGNFDNAGFPFPHFRDYSFKVAGNWVKSKDLVELAKPETTVVVLKDKKPVARINLAMLFSWANDCE